MINPGIINAPRAAYLATGIAEFYLTSLDDLLTEIWVDEQIRHNQEEVIRTVRSSYRL